MRASCSVILPSALDSHRRTAEFKAKSSESFSVRWLLTMRGIKKVVVFSLRSRDSGDLVKASEVHHACPFMPSFHARVLAPDAEAAKHAILAGVVIPTEGLVLPSSLIEIEPLTPDCRVLLWGEAMDSERKKAAQKQPILWTRELKRENDLPPRRIAFTTLGDQGDFANPEFRVISVQMIAWAIGEEAQHARAATKAPTNGK